MSMPYAPAKFKLVINLQTARVKAAINGRLPRGIGVTRLNDAPLEWSRQWHMLGLANPRPTQA